ncbi:hypothetical protein OESDEN_02006 [Oesophagostomum dentatum]|uniref:CB1 cannabinoid receptor-interacting protein 1 n=1 Tax=Oesophagostomum dentatum TaxID=61180 RepID=A0A0B1TKC3_OESDE|nr:hypothetical protein OESDEN_02006 [Oesophagostomum dentatum]
MVSTVMEGPPGTSPDSSSGTQYGSQQSASANQYQNQQQSAYGSQYQTQPQSQYGLSRQYDGTTQYPQGVTGYSSQGEDGLYSSSGSSGSHVSIQQYSFNNGNCQYEDGYIIDNGARRQATSEEIDRINQYKQTLNDYMKQVQGNVGDWVSNMFKNLPFNLGQSFPTMPNMPAMPEPPCLCSPQTCAQIQQQRNAIYGSGAQYDQQGYQSTGGQYQQTATYGSQYQQSSSASYGSQYQQSSGTTYGSQYQQPSSQSQYQQRTTQGSQYYLRKK